MQNLSKTMIAEKIYLSCSRPKSDAVKRFGGSIWSSIPVVRATSEKKQ